MGVVVRIRGPNSNLSQMERRKWKIKKGRKEIRTERECEEGKVGANSSSARARAPMSHPYPASSTDKKTYTSQCAVECRETPARAKQYEKGESKFTKQVPHQSMSDLQSKEATGLMITEKKKDLQLQQQNRHRHHNP